MRRLWILWREELNNTPLFFLLERFSALLGFMLGVAGVHSELGVLSAANGE
jgi:hypothetical protein